MNTITDQLSRTISLPHSPRRIVSLVPSITELLCDMGLETHLLGITKFCVRPAGRLHGKTIVGGTKNLRPDTIRALRPDLILANQEENEPAAVMALAEDFPVWVSRVVTLEDAYAMIAQLGYVLGVAPQADRLVADLQADFAQLAALPPPAAPRVAYLIWQKPLMVAGGDTFIHHVLAAAGLVNVFGDRTRYPIVTPDELRAVAPNRLWLSSEPFPFAEKHARAFRADFPATKVECVDGEVFSWYGSRMRYAAAYLRTWRGRAAG